MVSSVKLIKVFLQAGVPKGLSFLGHSFSSCSFAFASAEEVVGVTLTTKN